ncbi:Variant Ionotropic Glutamate Receptor [Penaeus vannamei]|uniref:Variant Ionotropic Glutamate Receptor n=1 Tax=Penaeus vannamei TaxID=6689 RepID=A0A3R7LRX1_PENVA|nr:Variant Ionotropic Glutamate Receptor [Penaeus vannamei]
MTGVPMLITRENANDKLDKSVFVYADDFSAMYRRPEEQSDVSGLFNTYTAAVWLLILAAFLGVVACLWAVMACLWAFVRKNRGEAGGTEPEGGAAARAALSAGGDNAFLTLAVLLAQCELNRSVCLYIVSSSPPSLFPTPPLSPPFALPSSSPFLFIVSNVPKASSSPPPLAIFRTPSSSSSKPLLRPRPSPPPLAIFRAPSSSSSKPLPHPRLSPSSERLPPVPQSLFSSPPPLAIFRTPSSSSSKPLLHPRPAAIPSEPQGNPLRIAFSLWLFVSLILASVYRSNLKAMLILPKVDLPFDDAEELADSGLPLRLTFRSMLHRSMLEAPPGSTLSRLLPRNDSMYFDLDFPTSVKEMEEGNLVIAGFREMIRNVMHDSFSKNGRCLAYVMNDNLLGTNFYSFLFPKGSPLKAQVDPLIVRLRQSGIMDYIFKKTTANATECLKPPHSQYQDKLRPLKLQDFYGAFLLYIGGIFIGLLAFLLELLWTHASQVVEEPQ